MNYEFLTRQMNGHDIWLTDVEGGVPDGMLAQPAVSELGDLKPLTIAAS